MKQIIKRFVVTVLVLLIIVVAGVGAFIYSGVYDMGADDPHTRPVFSLLRTLRDRSIAAHSKDLQVPDLADAALVLKGAGQYDAMCTQCHLAPGTKESEIRPGLYPQPPNLAQWRFDPKVAFWVIKHGIKMSAMPAWGGSHDDATIWSMVAFLQKLPELSPQQYKEIVAKAPPDDDMDMGADQGSDHGGGRSDADKDATTMSTMPMPARAASAKPTTVESRHHGG